MNRYGNDPRRLRALVEPDRVHRDVYLDPEIFELEMRRLWRRTWVYVGHESQVPRSGDFHTTDIAGQPVVMVRDANGVITSVGSIVF